MSFPELLVLGPVLVQGPNMNGITLCTCPKGVRLMIRPESPVSYNRPVRLEP
jgi:hypothetical protein